ncbi:hypothetical protein UPYG_G00049350 [Umbra pygmaea]|uniref:Uncharacterized protein n=1 Tax=Umbra pygmaea TaxID=75934 RepID=A0ABD0XRH7_UMBPY
MKYVNQKEDFLLDLFSHVKDYETQTGRSVLPALQTVHLSAPAVWSIDLSKRKTSLLLEVLKLQPEKKPVELKGWSDEESEVRSFLQCLPYISQLRFDPFSSDNAKQIKFLVYLLSEAAEREDQTREKKLNLISSVCSYRTFPFFIEDKHKQIDFLLDLFLHVKDYETQTGRSVLPALHTVYQSAPAVWSIDLSKRKTSVLLEVLKLQPEKKPVELKGWSDEESEVRSFLQCLPYISQLSFYQGWSDNSKQIKFLVYLLSEAAEREDQTREKKLNLISSVCSYRTFPFFIEDKHKQSDFLLDLFSHVKDHETKTGRSVLPVLQTVYQSAPAVWSIDLSERKTSVLLEVLKLQPEKKPVELKVWPVKQSEVRSFLQCLPYISQLSFYPGWSNNSKQIKFLVNLLSEAAEWEDQTGEKKLNLVSSVCSYSDFPLHNEHINTQSDFLLDLFSHVKDYETQTGRSVLPALQSVYQSAPAVWSIDLSERKTSVLLEVLKLQPEKRPVELKVWSVKQSEVRSFLQCLPYISQLRFYLVHSDFSKQVKFLVYLLSEAAEWEDQTGEKKLNLVSSVCSYSDFPFHNERINTQSVFLLDLFSHVKDYETQTGRSVLPALQSVYQSAPAVWSIDLSERKTSLLLEVLKLQPEKKPVELKVWSDEESEVRSFLQCLPYISQLSFYPEWSDLSKQVKFLVDLLSEAAEWEDQTGEKKLNLVSSVCSYRDFPFHNEAIYKQCNFLLDLFSYVKEHETKTGRSVLPALQTVYQSAPAVWSIDLSERKTSVLLEVLKLQPEKKPVELKGWSGEESEVRCFLQCLPYISQLSFDPEWSDDSEQVKFLVDLLSEAAEWEDQTGEKKLNLVSSVCSYRTFPLSDLKYDNDDDYEDKQYQCDFLLDLFSHVKDYETKTGRSFLPTLQKVYQSAPAVWSIDLSERQTSLLLEVLKLHPEKKPVELMVWSDEQSEVRSFLQCLPYISQLRFYPFRSDKSNQIKFLVDLLSEAAEWENQTGEKKLNLTVYQSAPAVWSIDLSERKTSLLLEVLKLQPEKKPVELKGWSDEQSEVRSFLQCLPHISQLRFNPFRFDDSKQIKFLVDLLSEAAEWEDQTGEKKMNLISSVCSYRDFPFHNEDIYKQSDFLLDLFSHVKDYETQTGRSVLPALQTVYQSVPAVWSLDLSKRQTSLLLEVLKLQPEKKPVELKVWSDEQSEVRSFLQCLPYISQLRFNPFRFDDSKQVKFLVDLLSEAAEWGGSDREKKMNLNIIKVLKLQPEKKPVELKVWSDEQSEVRSFLQCLPYISQLRFYPFRSDKSNQIKFLVDLLSEAAEWENQTGEKKLNLVSSVCSYRDFPFHNEDIYKQSDFLLDLFSHVKDYETKTGRSVLPALQTVYQSAPAVWSIDLSERKTSLLLEVLKLQPEKKPVELKGWSDEQSEVRSFLQCLPYISQLRFNPFRFDDSKQIKFLVDLLSEAAEWEDQTGEKKMNLISSVCSYRDFPFHNEDIYKQSDFLLDLFSHVKDYETQTGRSVLPALQTVYQSVPAVWSLDLSKRQTSLLLEVLKLQPEKKPVELKVWSDEQSEVRSFLQCLPYISQLR